MVMVNFLEKNDIVEITGYGEIKIAKVIDPGQISAFGSQSDVRVRYIEDGSEGYISGYLARKKTKEELIPTRCPICAVKWHISTGINETFHDCLSCNKTREAIIKELWGSGNK